MPSASVRRADEKLKAFLRERKTKQISPETRTKRIRRKTKTPQHVPRRLGRFGEPL